MTASRNCERARSLIKGIASRPRYRAHAGHSTHAATGIADETDGKGTELRSLTVAQGEERE